MQYRVYGGIQTTPAENLKYFFGTLQERNWLPAAVGTVTTLWISLLLVNIMQRFPADHGSPTVRPKHSAQQISVQPTSSKTSGPIVVTQSSGNVAMTDGTIATPRTVVARPAATNNVATVNAAQPVVDNTTNTLDTTIPAGTGGDSAGSIATPTDPVTSTTPPVVTVTPPVTPVAPTVPPISVTVDPPTVTGNGGGAPITVNGGNLPVVTVPTIP